MAIHVVRDMLGHANVSQTSTYLKSSLKVAHDAMVAFEARRVPRHDLATGDATRDHETPQPTATSDEMLSKDATDRQGPQTWAN